MDYRNGIPELNVSTADIWHTTYCGVPAVQAWQDFMLWERFLNLVKATSLIEIGTFVGGFSLFLQHQCYSRGMTFYTVDFQVYADFDNKAGALYLNGTKALFHHMDVWTPPFDDLFNGVLQKEDRIILLCDGGNKPKEMQTFVPRIRPGDLVAAHDWSTEIGDADLVLVKDMLSPIMPGECEALHSLTRFFRRI